MAKSKDKRISVRKLKRAMPKYGVPRTGDHPEYMRGYSDAVTRLHKLLDE